MIVGSGGIFPVRYKCSGWVIIAVQEGEREKDVGLATDAATGALQNERNPPQECCVSQR